jgi:hypothetical protein
VSYLVAAKLLGIEELSAMLAMLKRRVGRTA